MSIKHVTDEDIARMQRIEVVAMDLIRRVDERLDSGTAGVDRLREARSPSTPGLPWNASAWAAGIDDLDLGDVARLRAEVAQLKKEAERSAEYESIRDGDHPTIGSDGKPR